MRLLAPTVLILAPVAMGAAGAGVVFAQTPRSNVLILEANEASAQAPARLAKAFRTRGRVRPLLREGSGVHLGGEGMVPEGALERGRAALARGREYLRLLQFPEASSAFEEAIRELDSAGTPDAFAVRQDAEIALAVARLEAGERDAALRVFLGPLTRNTRLELDPVRNSPFVREALEEARSTVRVLPRGGLRVETSPSELDVWVDGRHVGKSPVLLEDLVSGRHVVAVVGARGPWSRIAEVPADSTARLIVLPDAGGSGTDTETALAVARALDADKLVIVSEGPRGRLRGRVADVSTGRLGVARESDSAEELAQALEGELGFRVAEARPEDGQEETTGGERAPWYENWWVYAIGIGLVGGTIGIAAVLASGEDDPFCPTCR